MKTYSLYLTALIALLLQVQSAKASSNLSNSLDSEYCVGLNKATITFRNQSDYSMMLKVMRAYGGVYSTVSLPPHSSRVVSFSQSGTFNLKIKATKNGHSSYHDGGKFSVACNDYEWTEGEMNFRMSSYGTGLGPTISAKEFESNN